MARSVGEGCEGDRAAWSRLLRLYASVEAIIRAFFEERFFLHFEANPLVQFFDRDHAEFVSGGRKGQVAAPSVDREAGVFLCIEFGVAFVFKGKGDIVWGEMERKDASFWAFGIGLALDLSVVCACPDAGAFALFGVGVARLAFLREGFVDFAVAVVVLVVAALFFGENLADTRSRPSAVDTGLLT